MNTDHTLSIKLFVCLAFSTISMGCGIPSVSALDLDADSKTLSKLSSRLNRSKSFSPAIKYRLYQRDKELIVSTYRHPLANLLDLKIDALLIAHECLQSRGTSFSGITVYFFNRKDNSKFWCAKVDRALFERLKKADLKKEEALSRVKLDQDMLKDPISTKYSSSTYEQIASDLSVSPGYLQEERSRLLKRIRALKQSGKDVSDLEKLFLQLDDTARLNGNDSGIKPLYIYTLQRLENKEKKKISALAVDNE